MRKACLLTAMTMISAANAFCGNVFTASLEYNVQSLENGKCKKHPEMEKAPVIHFDSKDELANHKAGEKVSILVHDGTIVTGVLTPTNVWEVCEAPQDESGNADKQVAVKLDTEFKWPRNKKLKPYLAVLGKSLEKNQVGDKATQALPDDLRKEITKHLPKYVKLDKDASGSFISPPGATGQYVLFTRSFGVSESQPYDERSYRSHTSFWVKTDAGWKLVEKNETATEIFSVTALEGNAGFELGLRTSAGAFSGYKYEFKKYKKGFVPAGSQLLYQSEGC